MNEELERLERLNKDYGLLTNEAKKRLRELKNRGKMMIEKISDEKYIILKLIDETMEIKIKYSKRSTLKKRLELLDKLKKLFFKLWNQ